MLGGRGTIGPRAGQDVTIRKVGNVDVFLDAEGFVESLAATLMARAIRCPLWVISGHRYA